MADVAAKAADVASATGSVVVLLVLVHVVPAAERFDPITVLTVVGTTGGDGSAGALVLVALRYCSLLTTRKRCPVSPSPRGEYTDTALLMSSSCRILMLVLLGGSD